jgi:threonine dehydrogenase-like Zn-dependent dehydrogenase
MLSRRLTRRVVNALPQIRYASDNKVALPNVGVIGAGQMGTGIALVSAMHAKTNVVLVDANKDSLNNAINFMSMNIKNRN